MMPSFKLVKNRCNRLFWYVMAMIIRLFTKVNNHQIICWSYGFHKYACNPRILTEYILKYHPEEYVIYWAFEKGYVPTSIDDRIRVVKKRSMKYLIALYTSKFVLCNSRNNRFNSMFVKKKSQEYIMTWHGPVALKRIEKDALNALGPQYEKRAKDDSSMCDLMLSHSRAFTNLIRKSFWYDGEILEKCSPRNDIFFDEVYKNEAYKRIRQDLNLNDDHKLVLYAPTFRGQSRNLKYYKLNWSKIIPCFEKMLGGKVDILVRLHPNMVKFENIESLTAYPHVHNVTQAPDITDFLFAADAMISDYTSAMFDYAGLMRPCFIYTIDKDEYDRGFYWKLEELPFALAENEEQLKKNVENFSIEEYVIRTNQFILEEIGIDEDGHSCERLYNWMVACTN